MSNRYPNAPCNSIVIGQEFEQFVAAIVKERFGKELTPAVDKKTQYEVGDFHEGVEVKYDGPSSRTGRLSIEVEARNSHNSNWGPEGILKCRKTKFYVQGNYDFFYVFHVPRLRVWAQRKIENGVEPEPFNDTIKRLWLPHAEALKMCRYYERIGIQSWMQAHIDRLNAIDS